MFNNIVFFEIFVYTRLPLIKNFYKVFSVHNVLFKLVYSIEMLFCFIKPFMLEERI